MNSKTQRKRFNKPVRSFLLEKEDHPSCLENLCRNFDRSGLETQTTHKGHFWGYMRLEAQSDLWVWCEVRFFSLGRWVYHYLKGDPISVAGNEVVRYQQVQR